MCKRCQADWAQTGKEPSSNQQAQHLQNSHIILRAHVASAPLQTRCPKGEFLKKLRAAMTEQRVLDFLFNSRANAHAGDGVIY